MRERKHMRADCERSDERTVGHLCRDIDTYKNPIDANRFIGRG